MIKLNEHEQSFPIKPVGVKYICEFCNDGEQVAVPDVNIGIQMLESSQRPMILHRCTKCGKEMMLPKSYPYIEWDVDEK